MKCRKALKNILASMMMRNKKKRNGYQTKKRKGVM
jgi:hypothetical protein